ncbi:biotin transporter BioY [Aquiluna borgnonia]|uniref:Biotin transporter n=1 Tax=Aquiluna borgnonia TaxID=2499157 RepID=A0A7D4PYY0_9MICO|nr:biotin transporter BioY [Aquiluna borgnonia]QKJ25325.1 biotin transporter BioY [Aquiluna borgnonia]
MTIAATLADRLVPRSLINNFALVMAGASLTAVAAQIQIPMIPVPMTLQTFAVLLVGATLGAGRGALSMATYLAMGAAGLPVFAAAKTLSGVLPTAGYLIGFVVAGALVGFAANRGLTKSPWKLALVFAGASIVIYALGVSGLMISLGLTLPQAIVGGVLPFVFGDVIKAIAAAALLPLAWKLIR